MKSLTKIILSLINATLILSLNFIGVFAQGPPNRSRNLRWQNGQENSSNFEEESFVTLKTRRNFPRASSFHKNQNFNHRFGAGGFFTESDYEFEDFPISSRSIEGVEVVDTIDLSQIAVPTQRPRPQISQTQRQKKRQQQNRNFRRLNQQQNRADIRFPQSPSGYVGTRGQIVRQPPNQNLGPYHPDATHNPFGPPFAAPAHQNVRRKDRYQQQQQQFYQQQQVPQQQHHHQNPYQQQHQYYQNQVQNYYQQQQVDPYYQQQQQQSPGLLDRITGFLGFNEVDDYYDERYPVGPDGNVILLSPADADYYGDFNGLPPVFPPKRPPTVSDKVKNWFKGFKPPPDFLKPGSLASKSPPPRVIHVNDEYEIGDDHNFILFNSNDNVLVKPGDPKPNGLAAFAGDGQKYDFYDVLDSLKKNESSADVAKKFFSAAFTMTQRSRSSPVYMMWTIPTTILALAGALYFVGAAAILGYQFMLGGGNTTALGPTLIALAIPPIIALIIVTARAQYNGEIYLDRMIKGDFRQMTRSDFDGVDFTLDAMFGASSILGIAWLASIAI